MKRLLLSFVAIATIAITSFGQAPEGFKYQAVVRDAGNTILNNQAVGMQIEILQGGISGAPVYTESFAPTTNTYGLVNFEIGTGTTSDDFTIIDWANDTYFIRTSIDVTGGSSYIVMGTSQLMSVPYALYAKTSGNGAGPIGPQGPAGVIGATGTNYSDYIFWNDATSVWEVSSDEVHIGNSSGKVNQGIRSVAIGDSAGFETQGVYSVAIGRKTGFDNQGDRSVAIGRFAGNIAQGNSSVAVGDGAGVTTQGNSSVAIGNAAGFNLQGEFAVAVGPVAGKITQGQSAIALGNNAGNNAQGNYAIGIGQYSGYDTQGQSAVAIGNNAGNTAQGTSSIAIGSYAGQTNQHSNTIILNASGVTLNSATSDGLYIAPVRSDDTQTMALAYNTATKEIVYSSAIGATGPQGPAGNDGLLPDGAVAGNTPYWNGSQWIVNSSNIYNNGGNVGIGTDNPQGKLHLYGAGSNGGGARLVFGDDYFTASNDVMTYVGEYGWESNADTDLLDVHGDQGIHFTTGRDLDNVSNPFKSSMFISGTSKVGIGNTNPETALHIGSYTTNINQYATIATQGGNLYQAGIKLRHFSSTNGWNLYSDEEFTNFGFHIGRENGGIPEDYLSIDISGQVGIHTNAPAADLDVNGTLKITDGTEGLGKILTSDASGNASWVAPAVNFDGDYNSLTNQPTIPTIPSNVSAFANDAGYITTEVDGSTMNELQTINRTGTTVTLSDGGGTFEDSVGVYTAGAGVSITNNVISATGGGCSLVIGQAYQGGIIFFLDDTGCHGLISASSNQSTGIQWNNTVDRYTGTTGDGLYAGSMNTTMIVATQISDNQTGSFAAKLCADYAVTSSGINYGDWYLPSSYELNLMYLNIGTGNALGLGNVGTFSLSGNYWSSSEANATSAYKQSFASGVMTPFSKVNSCYVRAIRAF